jgi:hypothetical protein
MPNVISTADVVGDQEGVLTTEVSFKADSGVSGSEGQIYFSFI